MFFTKADRQVFESALEIARRRQQRTQSLVDNEANGLIRDVLEAETAEWDSVVDALSKLLDRKEVT